MMRLRLQSEVRGGRDSGWPGWAGEMLSSRRQQRLELRVCAMAVLRHRRGLWGSELTSHRGPSKAWELGACPLRHQAFQKPPPRWRLLKGLVHQRTGTQLPCDRKRKRGRGLAPGGGLGLGGTQHPCYRSQEPTPSGFLRWVQAPRWCPRPGKPPPQAFLALGLAAPSVPATDRRSQPPVVSCDGCRLPAGAQGPESLRPRLSWPWAWPHPASLLPIAGANPQWFPAIGAGSPLVPKAGKAARGFPGLGLCHNPKSLQRFPVSFPLGHIMIWAVASKKEAKSCREASKEKEVEQAGWGRRGGARGEGGAEAGPGEKEVEQAGPGEKGQGRRRREERRRGRGRREERRRGRGRREERAGGEVRKAGGLAEKAGRGRREERRRGQGRRKESRLAGKLEKQGGWRRSRGGGQGRRAGRMPREQQELSGLGLSDPFELLEALPLAGSPQSPVCQQPCSYHCRSHTLTAPVRSHLLMAQSDWGQCQQWV
ncbi:hypothetical protein QTO34_008471 [Cnephaeus nilssonii]|uniref:Uncharacterized protein n=1 Tax=Cnephaeus nilssonii TaxID=3371016 RepID=A0AA40LW09_CNENI|nr:hypothetical protein QTO34_008471 [Eptesicus nilssonii]